VALIHIASEGPPLREFDYRVIRLGLEAHQVLIDPAGRAIDIELS
jgi:hypothetical protein